MMQKWYTAIILGDHLDWSRRRLCQAVAVRAVMRSAILSYLTTIRHHPFENTYLPVSLILLDLFLFWSKHDAFHSFLWQDPLLVHLFANGI